MVVDTIGVATPEAAAYLVGRTVDWLEVPVHWHGHDDFGLATAAAVAAVQAGATWVHGTVNGMGERAGNANLLEVALALEALYGIPTRLDLTKARELAPLVRERSGYELAPWTPLTGDNLFTRESGAVASQFHDPPRSHHGRRRQRAGRERRGDRPGQRAGKPQDKPRPQEGNQSAVEVPPIAQHHGQADIGGREDGHRRRGEEGARRTSIGRGNPGRVPRLSLLPNEVRQQERGENGHAAPPRERAGSIEPEVADNLP